MAPPRRHLLFAVLLLAACGSTPASTPSTPAPTSTVAAAATVTPRLSGDEQTALVRLAALSVPIDAAAPAHDHGTVTLVSSLAPGEQARFDAQILAAVEAAKLLTSTEAAAAAGYVQSSTQLPGIGTHWVRWSQIDAPFDAARPAMLLFDQSTLHPTRLAGFSYWVRSADPPEGFAGPNDVWHRHSGLCFENGWLVRENVPSADECAGEWLNGRDLWMLHAWVAPNVPNAAGLFAARNSTLCPPDRQSLPDPLKCGRGADDGHGDQTIVVPTGSVYCHLPTT